MHCEDPPGPIPPVGTREYVRPTLAFFDEQKNLDDVSARRRRKRNSKILALEIGSQEEEDLSRSDRVKRAEAEGTLSRYQKSFGSTMR